MLDDRNLDVLVHHLRLDLRHLHLDDLLHRAVLDLRHLHDALHVLDLRHLHLALLLDHHRLVDDALLDLHLRHLHDALDVLDLRHLDDALDVLDLRDLHLALHGSFLPQPPKGIFGDASPAMGMIGTLIGLVLMLSDMNDPKSIGPSMAVALLTTLYGALIANLGALPIADKLEVRTNEEHLNKNLVIESIAAIQEGRNPRVMEELLMSYMPGKIQDQAGN